MTSSAGLHLRIVTPVAVAVDADVEQVTAEALDGSFTLLPRHVDFAAALAQGLVVYRASGEEHIVAVDGGTLVKCGQRVDIATREAIPGDSTEQLEHELRDSFAELDEHERRARSAVARLESDVTRRLREMERDDTGW